MVYLFLCQRSYNLSIESQLIHSGKFSESARMKLVLSPEIFQVLSIFLKVYYYKNRGRQTFTTP